MSKVLQLLLCQFRTAGTSDRKCSLLKLQGNTKSNQINTSGFRRIITICNMPKSLGIILIYLCTKFQSKSVQSLLRNWITNKHPIFRIVLSRILSSFSNSSFFFVTTSLGLCFVLRPFVFITYKYLYTKHFSKIQFSKIIS